MSKAILTNGYPPFIQRQQLMNCRLPDHKALPILLDDSSVLSGSYINFKNRAQSLIQSGMPLLDVLGDPNVTHVDMFLRDRAPGDMQTTCNWSCELMRQLPELDISMRLAWIALLSRFMQVRASYDKHTYGNVV